MRWAGPSFVMVALGCAPPEELVKRKMKKKKKATNKKVGFISPDSGICLVLFCFVYDSSGFDGFSCSVSLFNLTIMVCKQKVEEKDTERAAN